MVRTSIASAAAAFAAARNVAAGGAEAAATTSAAAAAQALASAAAACSSSALPRASPSPEQGWAAARCDPCSCGALDAAATARLPLGWCARGGGGGTGGWGIIASERAIRGSAAAAAGGGGPSSSTADHSAGAAGSAAMRRHGSEEGNGDEEEDPLAAALRSGAASARHLTPREIVARLDAHIIGQREAKRAVAVALRNRWRRHRLDPAAAREVAPKNILMVGPTGCGKTEVARRLAKLVDAPFVKVEATKFTKLGYVGRDVDDIVKDLAEAAMAATRARLKTALAARAARGAEDAILRELLGAAPDPAVLEAFRALYRKGELDDHRVDLGPAPAGGGGGGGGGSGPEAWLALLERLGLPRSGMGGGMAGGMGGRRAPAGARTVGDGSSGSGSSGSGGRRAVKVRDARRVLVEREAERWLSQSDLVAREAVRAASEDGIVFIDEIDKLAAPAGGRRGDGGGGGSVSSEGVQRDLLPILEGSTVATKYGPVSTDHVLFVCSGAFHQAKPSDLLAELQGRLPVRVELAGLTADELMRVLTEPRASMLKQARALLAAEGVDLVFADGAARAVADAAAEANRLLDDIGARRLHTVLERVLADISFSAPERVAAARRQRAKEQGQQQGQQQQGQQQGEAAVDSSGSSGDGGERLADAELVVKHVVTAADVEAAVGDLLKQGDVSRYML